MVFIRSLKLKIPTIIIVLALISIVLTAFVSYGLFTKKIRQQIIDKNETISNTTSDQVSQYLSDAKGVIEYLARNVNVNDMDNVKREIDKAYIGYHWIDVIIFMSPEGKILYSKPHNDIIYERSYVDRDYYNYVMKEKSSYISKVFVGSIVKQPHIMIAVPIMDPITNEVKGIIGGGVPLRAIKNIVNKAYGIYDGHIYVIDTDTKVLVSPHDNVYEKMYLKRNVGIDGKTIDLKELAGKYEKGTGLYRKDFSNVYISFNKIKNYNGMIIVEKDEKSILDEINVIKSKFLSYLLVILSLILILSISLANSIVRPIKDLVNYTRKISDNIDKGVLNTKDIELNNNSEIRELEISFRNMAIELYKKIVALKLMHKREKNLRKYLDNILKSAGSGIIVINDCGHIAIFNRVAQNITGIKSEEIIDKSSDELLKLLGLSEEIIDLKNKKTTEGQFVINNIHNKEIPVDVVISPVLDKEEGIVSIVCILRDLTRIKLLEKELKIKDRLETMGQLSSAIIHEIGNPLAGMTNLLEVLRENIEDENVREDIISALNDEVDVLNTMVINFLDFTRISKNERVEANVYHIINSALNILNSQIKYKMIRIIEEISPNIPNIKIDPMGIRQVIVNILKNSIQAVGEYGIIHVKVGPKGNNHVEIVIRDNGNGIKKEMIDKVFNPLFTTKEEGNGLGLYVVHNIVVENGGSITVNSEEGKYTEFILDFKGE
ncbi:MAG: cache domain-containing protein [Anaeromicrobium sp.]|uniref:ATP-binding protein n=1 Tax=Anaeromicrobium sp. TaxID=1929132 RepID=UPI0025EEF855|nr:ATP-binding protein [Anaeromicrobium sp.]MCT4594061.1 cache domain-containing protein [Anaeromicrobium sp.]